MFKSLTKMESYKAYTGSNGSGLVWILINILVQKYTFMYVRNVGYLRVFRIYLRSVRKMEALKPDSEV